MKPTLVKSWNEVYVDECRCTCGKLMAKLTANGVEVQCKRCKEIHLIPFSAATKNDEAV